VQVSGVDEEAIRHPDPRTLVQQLARAKAEAVAAAESPVLGCDSLLVFEGEVFGKPLDAAEAQVRWRRMAGGWGELITGHCLIPVRHQVDAAQPRLAAVVTRVQFAPISVAEEKIARARFKLYGTNVYPDATFTLRLNYGTVQGWVEKGRAVDPFTRLETAFARATGQPPFQIPDSWQRVKDRLNMATPVNISTNNDIVGGNSGSPLLNSRGEIVGLMFDGNIHSISGAYWFDTEKNRSIAVHPAIMREALEKVYGAADLLRELEGRPLERK
jgi:hypothetical protein